jgi:hypothetical protein
VKTQLWCAVATYVLIAIVKKELQLDTSLYTGKPQLPCALQLSDPQTEPTDANNQLLLFNSNRTVVTVHNGS